MTYDTGDGEVPATLVTLQDIEQAHKRIAPHVHRTPLLTSSTLDRIATEAIAKHRQTGASSSRDAPPIRIRLAFKSEHLQKCGAFKSRGANNAVQSHLERLRGQAKETGKPFDPANLWVVTHSSGNHAAALAFAARSVGARCAVVMPRNAPGVKKAAVRGYGARVVECEPTQAEREATANKLMAELSTEETGKNTVQFVHPYDEELVIAGQGTLALEMLQQAEALQSSARRCSEAPPADSLRQDADTWTRRTMNSSDSRALPPLDIVVAPVGGGGMLSGVSTAIKSKDERIVVYAAEPEAADDAARSFHSGELQPAITPPQTICDGLLTALSPRTMKHVQKYVTDIFTASDADIIRSMQLVWERMKQIIEPSASVGLAVVLNSPAFAHAVHALAATRAASHTSDEAIEIRIGLVVTGGNVELGAIAKAIAEHGVLAS